VHFRVQRIKGKECSKTKVSGGGFLARASPEPGSRFII